jgi:hypothetical protein
MSQLDQQNLSRESFLTMAGNILFKSLLELPRTQAKQVFRKVDEGGRIALITVRMENDADVRFDLSLDSSEFRGRLNYGAFRASVATLVASISQQLKDGVEVPVFSEQSSGTLLFGVPAPTEEAGEVNVLMLAADLSGAGSVHLKLQYMDPDQFRAPADTA